MNFNSLQYLLFLPVVVLLYYLLPRRLKDPMLLIASYYFYMCWQPAYAALMFFSTAVTWASGLLMARYPAKRRLWLGLSLLLNLAILFVFKYFNFFSHTLASLFGRQGPTLDVLLPVGISFYTFQALGYSIDVYRGDLPAEKNFLTYALFVSFFPQLVAGPIERADNILPQLKQTRPFRWENLQAGMLPILWGLFKKIVIADNLAVLVNTAYGDVAAASGAQLFFATGCFAFQIYCDFSAYTDIARGSAKFLGIDLMQNFNAPYAADSVRDFWRRWHISLSGWFRDYLYFPLGGSRVPRWRHCLNVLIVFLVSGLWHGAAMTYVVWGLLHGLFQIVEILTRKKGTQKPVSAPIRLCRILRTFALVCFAWIFFRAASLSDALLVIQRIFTAFGRPGSVLQLGLTKSALCSACLAVVLLVLVDLRGADSVLERISRSGAWRFAAYYVLCMAIFLFGYYGAGYNPQDFIYFQF